MIAQVTEFEPGEFVHVFGDVHIYSNHFNLFFNDTATTEIYTLSLHDALPISTSALSRVPRTWYLSCTLPPGHRCGEDRKSTRLNSSHDQISYAVFCL